MNTVILIGRLTKAPELRYVPGTGRPVATFNLAVDRPFQNKDGKKVADFFNIVVWGKLGENCANYLDKGRLVAVKGSIQNRSYETQTGEKRYVTEIIADSVDFLSGNSKSENSSNGFEEPNNLFPEGFDPSAVIDDDEIPFVRQAS